LIIIEHYSLLKAIENFDLSNIIIDIKTKLQFVAKTKPQTTTLTLLA